MTEPEFEQRVQRKAGEHLAACHEAMEAYSEHPDADVENPAYGPFCGCDTCVVREVLSVCWEEMLAEARREVDAQRRNIEMRGLRGDDGCLPKPDGRMTDEQAAALYLWAIGDGRREPPKDARLVGSALRTLLEIAGDKLGWEPIEPDLGE